MTLPKVQSAHADDRLWSLTAALCDGSISPEDLECLEALLHDDEDARLFFAAYMDLHGRLLWRFRSGGQDEGRGTGDQRRGMAGSPAIDVSVGADNFSVGAAVELPLHIGPEPRTPIPGPPASPFPLLSPLPSPLSPDFVGSPIFSYLTAAVILGMGILGAWAYTITHHQHIAEAPSPTVPSRDRPEMVFVGRITGMKDCKWSDPSTEPFFGAYVPLGRRYALASGLMQITYDSGAKVILEGPCTYEVDSNAGGYLSLGKLTAKVDKRGGGRGTRGEGDSHYPLSTIHYPLFSVRTPTAVVTDLGTEFGVEVNKEGTTITHVFQGKVELRSAGSGNVISLGENESARVERGQDRIVKVIRGVVQPNTFARRMPKWVPIKLFNTGVGLKEGDADPHWSIVATGFDPLFRPRAALVTATHPNWRSNNPETSQWISLTARGVTAVPLGTYTFRTTFELDKDFAGASIEIRGRYVADNLFVLARLNGRETIFPPRGSPPQGLSMRYFEYSMFTPFRVAGSGVMGVNTLELVVENPGIKPTSMGLIVELQGFARRDRNLVNHDDRRALP